jgi:hypothetical protein
MKANICQQDFRREDVRTRTSLNGLDFLEVSDDQLHLTVYFLGKAPGTLSVDNFIIEGGRRIHTIKILSLSIHRVDDPELDDTVTLNLDRYGDFSIYTLRLVNTEEPVDPFYNRLDFSFKVNCPNELDCKEKNHSSPKTYQTPEINYLAKDYASFRQLILDRLALTMPDWRERHAADIGTALIEVLAYTADHLSYYQDAVATEAYLDTARQRISVRRHARLVDYRMHEGCNSRAWICINVTGAVQINPCDAIFAAGLRGVPQADKPVVNLYDLANLPSNSWVAFEALTKDPSRPLTFCNEHNEIPFYTWGYHECCLPKGSTNATLLDKWVEVQANHRKNGIDKKTTDTNIPVPSTQKRILSLNPGDVLIFEEVLGPNTGDAADADPSHRHAVRLNKVTQDIDPLNNTPVVEIEWSPEDALPFTLRLSAQTDAEHGCIYKSDISIARANVILVDQGLTIDKPEMPDPCQVMISCVKAECECDGRSGEKTIIPERFRTRLSKTLLTFRQRLDFSAPALKAMEQDPRMALPQVNLTSRQQKGSREVLTTWEPRFDLLSSSADDPHFVVEIDNAGYVHLRFGDGKCGRIPEAGMTFSAVYRIGNGPQSDVGPESITHLIYRKEKIDGIISIRNPQSACGGKNPESINEVKRFAPFTYKKQLQRAITADDYARIIERDPRVQRAGATLRWNGSWYELQASVDPLGSDQAGDDLLLEIEKKLYPFRRMCHDLRINPACYVYLDICLTVCVKPEYLRNQVKAELIKLFSNRSLPGGQLGFFHPDNLTFGEGIFLSRIISVARKVDGVQNVEVSKLQRLYEKPDHEIENGVLPITALEIARCDNDPNYPEHGKFEIIAEGGK